MTTNKQGSGNVPEGFKKQNPDFIEWGEDGVTELQFVYTHRDVVNMPNGPVAKYFGNRKDGTPVSFLGSSILDQVFQNASNGEEYYVVFTGKEKVRSGGQMNVFEIYKHE